MTQIATTIEQSRQLLELGVPAETADMRWDRDTVGVGSDDDIAIYDLRTGGYCGTYETPAWTLNALLALLPKQISSVTYLGADEGERELDCELWFRFYSDAVSFGYGELYVGRADDFFEAIFILVEWVCEWYPDFTPFKLTHET
jgi:hypothetical protein